MDNNEEFTKKIFNRDKGLSWEQRLDFLLKAVNDTSKSLNEAAQSSKILHHAMKEHNELLTMFLYLISSHLYDDGECQFEFKKHENNEDQKHHTPKEMHEDKMPSHKVQK
jgi:hypothetical protein